MGCAPGFGLSGVCAAAAQAEAHVHLGTGATSHPRVRDTGTSETRALVCVPAAHKVPCSDHRGSRTQRRARRTQKKNKIKQKTSPLHPTPLVPGPFRGSCPLSTHAHTLTCSGRDPRRVPASGSSARRLNSEQLARLPHFGARMEGTRLGASAGPSAGLTMAALPPPPAPPPTQSGRGAEYRVQGALESPLGPSLLSPTPGKLGARNGSSTRGC